MNAAAAGPRAPLPGWHTVTPRIIVPEAACRYVYVKDADRTWRRAVDADARSLESPMDTPYGDRRGMVVDAWGNTWQIGSRRTGAGTRG